MIHSRRGFTLIELLLAMSAGSALMALAIGALHQSFTLASTSRERCHQETAMCRLADQFRRDVHQAAEIASNSPSHIQLENDANQITYTVTTGLVTRERIEGSERHVDQFDLGNAREIRMEVLENPSRGSLTIQRNTGLKHVALRLDRNVIAVVGRLVLSPPSEVSTP